MVTVFSVKILSYRKQITEHTLFKIDLYSMEIDLHLYNSFSFQRLHPSLLLNHLQKSICTSLNPSPSILWFNYSCCGKSAGGAKINHTLPVSFVESFGITVFLLSSNTKSLDAKDVLHWVHVGAFASEEEMETCWEKRASLKASITSQPGLL